MEQQQQVNINLMISYFKYITVHHSVCIIINLPTWNLVKDITLGWYLLQVHLLAGLHNTYGGPLNHNIYNTHTRIQGQKNRSQLSDDRITRETWSNSNQAEICSSVPIFLSNPLCLNDIEHSPYNRPRYFDITHIYIEYTTKSKQSKNC